MYLERLKKIQVLKDLIEKQLIQQGEFPEKAYVERLLNDINTRYAIFDYDNVAADTKFDLGKMLSDLRCIQKDLVIIYEIIDNFTKERYIKLESYVNGYLSSLENIARQCDRRAMEELETTSLNADIIFFMSDMTVINFENKKAIIDIGSLSCTPQSKVFGSIMGSGFDIENVVFEIGGKKLSPNSVNNSALKVGGVLKKNTYTYSQNDDYPVDGAFRIPNSSIVASEKNKYEVYGGRDKIMVSSNSRRELMSGKEVLDTPVSETTTYTFYLTEATKIIFDFSSEPVYKNFSSYDIRTLKRDKMYRFEFTVSAGTAFSWHHDGTTFATKEKVGLNGTELYVAEKTLAKDFLIYEYAPGEKVTYDDVRVVIYDVDHETFRLDSIAIKEISETGVVAV